MASISAPTLLATFQTSHASSSKDRHVTLSPVHGSEGELAVLAVQGDGVWTYDLKTLRPTSSYTVPPSTMFSSYPVSYLPPPIAGLEKGKGKAQPQEEDAEMSSSVDSEDAVEVGPRRTTLVGVQSPEIGKEGQRSGEIWCWRGEDDEKTVIKSDHLIQSLNHLTSTNYPILAVGADGSLFLVDTSDQLIPLPHTTVTGQIISSRIVSTAGGSSGIVLVARTGQIFSFRIDHPEEGECSARLTNQSDVGVWSDMTVLADVAEDGTVTTISSSSKLFTKNIRTPPSSSPPAPLPYLAIAPALVSVPSTQSLILHAVTQPTPSLVLSLLSSGTPVILAGSDISAFSAEGEISQVNLLGKASAYTWTVSFVVWHKHSDKDTGRSVVYTCELALPQKGFGMNLLLGSQERTAKYMVSQSKEKKKAPKPEGAKVASEEKAQDSPDLATLLEGSLDAKAWKSVRRLMKSTPTLSSSTLVAILKRAIADGNINLVYADFLSLPAPTVDFRFELRRNVSVEEATRLLSQLVKWCDQWCQHRTDGLVWPDSQPVTKSPTSSIPSLDSILAHSSLLLDSHLPLFVEHESAAPLLESLAASLGPLLTLQAEIRKLCAPVDALLTLSKREEKRRAELNAKKENMRSAEMVKAAAGSGGGRKKIGAPKPGAGAELMGQDIGKWKVEDFVF